MIAMMVSSQRTAVQAMMNAVPPIGMWFSMPKPTGWPKTRSAAAVPARITVPAVSDDFADLLTAAWTASVSTPDAPGGSALFRPLTSLMTVPEPRRIRLAAPSSAMSAGNSARNQ